MKRHLHRYHSFGLPYPHPSKATAAIFTFSSLMFVFLVGDAIMAYFAPVYIQSFLQNTFLTGIVLSTSSMVGFIADILMGEWFKHKPLYHFLFWACVIGLLYPISFLLLPPLFSTFILSMAIWGIYFELVLFTKFHFINRFLSHQRHALGWAVMGGFSDLAYIIGPVIAGITLSLSSSWTLLIALCFYFAGSAGFVFFAKKHPTHAHLHSPAVVPQVPNFPDELAVWRLLLPRIWPVMLLVLTLTSLDATMWSLGAILSENYISQHLPFGEALFVAYLLPSLFMGPFAHQITHKYGKKRIAFGFGSLAGLVLIVAGFMPQATGFVIAIFFSSLCTALTWPSIRGTVEDYIERLGEQGNLMVSLQNSTTSLAYVFGSIFAGFVALFVGQQKTFSVMGLILLLVSLTGLLVLRKKVYLPQQAITLVTSD